MFEQIRPHTKSCEKGDQYLNVIDHNKVGRGISDPFFHDLKVRRLYDFLAPLECSEGEKPLSVDLLCVVHGHQVTRLPCHFMKRPYPFTPFVPTPTPEITT